MKAIHGHLPRTIALLGAALLLPGCAILNQAASGKPITAGDLVSAAASVTKGITDALDNISMKDERALGQAAALFVIDQNRGLLLDQELSAYVNEVGNLVAQSGGERKLSFGKKRTEARRFFFGVLNSDEVNAYACPGGYIFVTRGLFELLSSESDLAFVLGHEIAHVDQEDGLTALKLQAGAIGGLKALGPEGGESIFENQEVFGKIAGKLAEIIANGRFNKKDERNADEQGLDYAIAAGYDAHGADRVLEVLAVSSKKSRTHQPPRERLALLRARIDGAAPGSVGAVRFDRKGAQRVELARGR